MTDTRVGSIEAGGTKFVLAVVDSLMNILSTETIPTTNPEETLERCTKFFTIHKVKAIGVGSFGPIEVNPESKSYGRILNTPKLGWSNVDIVGYLRNSLRIPIAFTTDVNASAYGEYVAGSYAHVKSLVYFTIGTGIGGGAIQNGMFVGGVAHSEMGHAVALQRSDDKYSGGCPFHQNRCFEGLAAGPTIQARTGIPGENLERSNTVFDLISYYAGQMAFDVFANLAPTRIIFGGSVLSGSELPKVRMYFDTFNNGYLQAPPAEELIVMSSFANNESATLGDAALALKQLAER